MDAIAWLAELAPLEPDSLLRAQRYRRPPCSPEERLMLAVLEDALACFQRGSHAAGTCERQLFMEACTWIFSRDRGWPFAFESICETFRIDPVYIRCALARWVRCQAADAGGNVPAQPTLRAEEALACMRMRDTQRAAVVARGLSDS